MNDNAWELYATGDDSATDNKLDAGIDKETKTMKLLGLVDQLIEDDPDRAERVLESILARHALKKQLTAARKK